MSGRATVPTRPPERARARELQRAAAELFFTKGYEATTLREIARALGIKSASIYYHWDSKETILFDLIRSTMEQLTAGARSVLEREPAADRRLAGIVVHHVVLHALRPKEATLGDTELRSLTRAHARAAMRMRDEYESLLLGVLEDGARRDLFDVLDVKLTAYAVISQCTNVGIWYRPDGRLSLDEVAAVHANLALRTAGGRELAASAMTPLVADAKAFHEAWR
ncbi:MAG TPA: TetR/AcrR family transcriptional regulator [Gaiellaceae bacterium]|nr:TetR/AcrR family transcriptional regulator [Gaiellaceae bacterium]